MRALVFESTGSWTSTCFNASMLRSASTTTAPPGEACTLSSSRAQARQPGLYAELCLCPRDAYSADGRRGMHTLVIESAAEARQTRLYADLCLCPRHAHSVYDRRGMTNGPVCAETDGLVIRRNGWSGMRRDRGSQVSSRIRQPRLPPAHGATLRRSKSL